MPVIPELRRQNQEVYHKFKDSLAYIGSSKPARATEQDSIYKKGGGAKAQLCSRLDNPILSHYIGSSIYSGATPLSWNTAGTGLSFLGAPLRALGGSKMKRIRLSFNIFFSLECPFPPLSGFQSFQSFLFPSRSQEPGISPCGLPIDVNNHWLY